MKRFGYARTSVGIFVLVALSGCVQRTPPALPVEAASATPAIEPANPRPPIAEAVATPVPITVSKDEPFAPFVRRVAVKVFQAFWTSIKGDLAPLTFSKATLAVNGSMTREGRVRFCTGTDVSPGAEILLRRFIRACETQLSDTAPPTDAVSGDGTIELRFLVEIEMKPTAKGKGFWIQMAAGVV